MIAGAIVFAIALIIAPTHTRTTSKTLNSRKDHPDEHGTLGNYSRAAVAVDSQPCAQIALDILLKNGTAVDAAVAGAFCSWVHMSKSGGIGGGFIMTIYIKASRQGVTVMARETAPLAATKDMFHGNASLSVTGPLSIAVPGSVKGLWMAKEKYGNPEVKWSWLLQPSINMCRDGVTVSRALAESLEEKWDRIQKDPGMKKIFLNEETGKPYREADVFTWPNLADTLERIAKNGWKEFHYFETAKNMLEDLETFGSIITKEDLITYEPEFLEPTDFMLDDNLKLYSPLVPGSGPVLALILGIMKNYDWQDDMDLEDGLANHRIVEAFKYAYAQRTFLADPFDEEYQDHILQVVANLTNEHFAEEKWAAIDDFSTFQDPAHYGAKFGVKYDEGTSHLSVLSETGDAVSITSTINSNFGSLLMSPKTGIIFNNEMDDFSSPNITNDFGLEPAPANYIKPGKRPLSSTVPTIIVDNRTGDVRMVTGGAGGSKITSMVALTIMRHLWKQWDIRKAIAEPRIHHQLLPMSVWHEENLSPNIKAGLEERGHVLEERRHSKMGVAVGITKGSDNRIYAYSDWRKDPGIAGY